MKCSFGISNFLEEISSLSILLFSSISLHCSLKMAFLSLLAILRNFAFSWVSLSLSPLHFGPLLFSAISKDSSHNHFAILHFFFFGMFLVFTSCSVLQISVYSSSGILFIRYNHLSIFHFHTSRAAVLKSMTFKFFQVPRAASASL